VLCRSCFQKHQGKPQPVPGSPPLTAPESRSEPN
jgi:hypothetical protein